MLSIRSSLQTQQHRQVASKTKRKDMLTLTITDRLQRKKLKRIRGTLYNDFLKTTRKIQRYQICMHETIELQNSNKCKCKTFNQNQHYSDPIYSELFKSILLSLIYLFTFLFFCICAQRGEWQVFSYINDGFQVMGLGMVFHHFLCLCFIG